MRSALIATLAALTLVPAAGAQTTRLGQFRLVEKPEAHQAILYTPAVNRPGYLAWACVSGNLKLYLSGDRALGTYQGVPLQADFDGKGRSEVQAWDQDAGGRGAYAPDEMLASFTSAARAARQVVIYVGPSGAEQPFSFNLKGLGENLKKLPCSQAELLAKQ